MTQSIEIRKIIIKENVSTLYVTLIIPMINDEEEDFKKDVDILIKKYTYVGEGNIN